MPTPPDDYVLIHFDTVLHETAKAYLFAASPDDLTGDWFPKSQIYDLHLNNKTVWVPRWMAEQKGLQYD